jgi:RNA-directed DNA polymerase
MISDSPHLYIMHGLEAGTSPDVLEAALEQAEVPEGLGLASVLTLNHLAHQTRTPYIYLRGIAERRFDPYRDIQIARRNGRPMRAISTPEPLLMNVQRWINSRILARIDSHPASFAYEVGKSIKLCASKHLSAEWLVKIDIRNFFESITEDRIVQVFKTAGYQPLPALELARVCTRYPPHADHVLNERYRSGAPEHTTISAYRKPFRGFLPQGAPTSGALANLVCRRLDAKMAVLARNHGTIYTRYADDMVFSGGRNTFRRRQAERLVHEAGKIVPPGARKIVLGLLVDGMDVRLSRRLRQRILLHIRGAEKFGLANHVQHVNFTSIDGFVNHVSGLLAFAADIEPEWARNLRLTWQVCLARNGWTVPDAIT